MKNVKNLTRCSHGHFYDGGKYDACPHCRNIDTGREAPPTEILSTREETVSGLPQMQQTERKVETVMLSSNPADGVSVQIMQTPGGVRQPDDVTVHFYQKALGTEPVVAWLVCVKGMHFGQDFRLKSGRNFIGRDGKMDVCLSGDMSVSRDRHAILTYDPKGNTFLAQPGDSSELCYLNDKPLLIPTVLNPRDTLTLGDTELVFIPFCDESFTWKDREQNT